MGTFDYLKNFSFLFAGYYIFRSRRLLLISYKTLTTIAIICVIVAVSQEILFLLGKISAPTALIRFGLMRTPSLLGHPNLYGLYIFLVFTIRLFLKRKIDFLNILFLIGIFLSISRFVWISTIFILFVYTMNFGKFFYKFAFLFLFIGFSFFSLPYFLLHTSHELLTQNFFRGYALYKSIEIWNDNKILGVGPGMFGGVVSIIFNSPIYYKYDFSYHWFNFMKNFNSIDQFYPQLLAETGILGFLSFIYILFILFKNPRIIYKKRTRYDFFSNFIYSLSWVPLGLILYLFGSGLNMVAFLIPYFLLLGISIGVVKNAYPTRKQISFSKRWRRH